ncbi:MAG: amino acid permease, partial [Muribaculaceae bacterium]|nr:amino acid permease [Muribaculaceae bacterium]
VLYFVVSVFCYGVMSRGELAGLEDPSVAYCLREVSGPWAYWLVILSVIISLGGGWVAWTLVCAEVPYAAARVKIFPHSFLRLNSHGMPAYGLGISSVVMTLFLLLVMTADDLYLSALNITGMMILPCYLLCGVYLLKTDRSIAGRLIGAGCTLFCGWMIYSGGLDLFIETSLFYLPGLTFYVPARRQLGARLFSRGERIGLSLLILAAGYSLFF